MKIRRRRLTLRELVEAVQDVSSSDREAVAVIGHMLRTRRILRPLPLGFRAG